MKPLAEAQIQKRLSEAELWKREGQEIKRVFQFPGFMESISFVNQVAAYAEQVNHHPDILIQYNKVTLALSTHDANGLTEKDFDFARVSDDLFHKC